MSICIYTVLFISYMILSSPYCSLRGSLENEIRLPLSTIDRRQLFSPLIHVRPVQTP